MAKIFVNLSWSPWCLGVTRPFLTILLGIFFSLIGALQTEADDASSSEASEKVSLDVVEGKPREFPVGDEIQRIMMQTLGGRQFWADLLYFQDWRIQRNVFTGHCRLLDGHDTRHATGSYESCCDKLAEIREERQLPAMTGPAVVLLHGIVRSSKCFHRMRKTLNEAGYLTVAFEYPSTQIDIPTAADNLQQVLQHLEGVEQIDFVGHSMGGLVVRAWAQKYQDARVRRLVMLGTPNQGAEMADRLEKMLLYRFVLGPAGQQLVTHATGLIATMPPPPFEFAVIAGGRGDEKGWNPLIPGDDDGTVAVERAKLTGSRDFLVLPVLHTLLTSNAAVIEQTVHFLEQGTFRREAGEDTRSENDRAGG